ncbi:MAG: flavocytochrome c [Paraclostridium sp.]
MNYTNGSYIGTGRGYASDIKLNVIISDSKIKDIEVISHGETKVISDPAFEHVIKNIIEKNTILVPNVSGCSMTSRGIREAVKDALIQAGADKAELEALILDAELLEKIKSGKTRKLKDIENYDVVVVGGGGAGLSAAIEASTNGAKVVLVEKMNNLGGNTLVSMGGVNIPENDEQKSKNIVDTKDSYREDIIVGGDEKNDVSQVEILVQNALPTYRWLKDFVNVEFKEDKLIHFGGHKVPRAAVFKGKYAIELIQKLREKAEEIGVNIVTGVECTSLVCEDNRIVGVNGIYNDKKVLFEANYGVILATGGFSGNVEMRKKYDPSLDERYKTTNVSGVTGQGHEMCEAFDAKFVDMNYIQTFPICNPLTGELSHVGGSRFDGAILVNKEGHRFVEELERRDVVSEGILTQTGGVAYLVWSKEVEAINEGVAANSGEVKRLEKDNQFGEFETIEEACKFFDIDYDVLTETINKYNSYVDNKKDEDFNRRGELVSIKEGPYYVQIVAPAVHHTMGGVKINDKNQVLRNDDTVIGGLYAAGEIVGGTHGTNRLGGNAITEILVFGKRCGKSIVDNK